MQAFQLPAYFYDVNIISVQSGFCLRFFLEASLGWREVPTTIPPASEHIF